MFGNLSQRAHNVMMLAQKEALSFGHAYLGTAHLLLGLSGEGASVAAGVLRELGVEPDDARGQVVEVEGYGLGDAGDSVPLTPRAGRALEAASRESLRQGRACVGTDHLLLGLLGERGGISDRVLLNLGVDPDEALREARDILRGRGTDGDDPLERVPYTES
jgi:ATP-dependent Clp protease ATP-binding subunit ClpC